MTTVLTDPVYLTEPVVKSQEFLRSARELPAGTWLWVCDPVVETVRDEGTVPAYMPGEHPFADEFARRHGIPVEATRGGAATMYPEYQEVLKKLPKPPPLPRPAAGATRVTGPGQQNPAPAPAGGQDRDSGMTRRASSRPSRAGGCDRRGRRAVASAPPRRTRTSTPSRSTP